MYTERNGNFSIKNVILQFLFVALFIFLLIWLFPMKSDLNKALEGVENTQDMSVFYDQIFNNNVIAMKDAAKSYYTNERLPQKVGDKVSMNLGEMLSKKIILPFVDSKGKQCDLVDSYVEITKYETEYVMKVNLKCSEQENYLLVYMGCYDYCSTTICEKNKSDVKTPEIYPTPKPEPKPEPTPSNPSCGLKVLSGNKNGNVYTGPVVVGFASKVSGSNATLTGFGLGTNVNYNGNTEYSLTKPGTYTVYGYVKNSFGNTSVCSINVTIEEQQITVPEPIPSCSLKVESGNKNGNVYTGTVVVGFNSKTAGENGKLTGFGLGTSENYDGNTKYSLTKPGTYTVYGYVKNDFGMTSTCSIKVTIEEKVKEYEYEYIKKTITYSDWSNWSEWTEEEKTVDNILTKAEYRKIKRTTLVGYKTTTTNDVTKPIYGTVQVAVGTLSEKVCTEYGYVETGDIAYTAWQDAGYVTSTTILKNTDLERYVPVTDTETLCQEHCSSTTGHVYKKQVRKVVTGATYTCKNTATVTKLITANKTIITGYEQITNTEPVYETSIITQYRYSTRTASTKEDIKWSSYNNTKLLNAGYNYTGNKREIKNK